MPRFLATGLAALGFLTNGCATVHTEVVIPSDPERVWSVLTDFEAYPDWNPFFRKIDGELGDGERLVHHVREPNGNEYTIDATIRAFEPPRTLHRGGGFWGILTFDHHYRLEPVEGGTRVVQEEDYTGVGVLFWDRSWVEPAYSGVNEALRDRVAALEAGDAN